MNRQTGGQTDGQTDGQMNRQWVEAIDALPKHFPDLRVDLDLLLKGFSGSATGATLKSLIPSNELSEY